MSRGLLPRVISCHNQAPLCQTNHLAVKATIKVRVKLAHALKSPEPQLIKRRDHLILRPFTPSFDVIEFSSFIANVRRGIQLQSQEDVDKVPTYTCEMLQRTMQYGALRLPIREKPSSEWWSANAFLLEPLRLHRNALLRKWGSRGRLDRH